MLIALVAWALVGVVISHKVEPKVTRLALMVFAAVALWPLTLWLEHRRGAISRRRAALVDATESR